MAETTARLLTLADLLQSHRQWPGPELARRLSVTERTLRRDVERLRELGYRIKTVRGPAGGYRLEAGRHLPPLVLSDDEAVAMAIGVRLTAAQGLAEGAQTTLGALAKLEQVLPPRLRRKVNALGEHVLPQTPYSSPIAPKTLARLALACRDREQVRFSYVAWSGDETNRFVEPHSLVAAQRYWFLVCWDLDRAAWRTFRVDRMGTLRRTGAQFVPRSLAAPDAAEYVRAVRRDLARRQQGEVVIALPLSRVRELLGRWARDAVAVDDQRTTWPIAAESYQQLLSALVWLPRGVEFELRGSDEFLSFAREWSGRLTRAVG